jgi:hypothetical protein
VAARSPCSTTPRRDSYERRRPDETLLYQLIEEHWPTFLERAEESGLPDFGSATIVVKTTTVDTFIADPREPAPQRTLFEQEWEPLGDDKESGESTGSQPRAHVPFESPAPGEQAQAARRV